MGGNRETIGLARTKEYFTWINMVDRCNKTTSINYKYYGGKGIKVCDRWLYSFKNFLEDMGHRPFPKAQIDRIDNDGNYEPSNCRWVTAKENSRHSSFTKLTMIKATKIRNMVMAGKSYRKIADIMGISHSTVSDIVKNRTWI